MNKLSKLITTSAFIMVVGLSIASTSLQAKADTQTEVGLSTTKVVGVNKMIINNGMYLNSDVHQQKYLTYLVNEYAPDSIGDWQAAFAERNKVEAAMPKPENIKAGVSGASDQFEFAPQLDITKDNSTGSADSKKKLVIKLPDGSTIFSDLGEGEFSKVLPGDPMTQPEMMAKITAEQKLMADFEQAVDSNNASAIKDVLPKVLADYQKITQQMVQLSEQLKSDPNTSDNSK